MTRFSGRRTCASSRHGEEFGEVAQLAGVDFFTFQRALGERSISTVTEPMLSDDLETLKALFPQ